MSLTPRVDRLERQYIINGALDFWQRVAGNTTTVNSTSQQGYTADRMFYSVSASTSRQISIARSSTVPAGGSAGFQSTYSYQVTSNAAHTFAASDVIEPLSYKMEGYDFARLHGKPVSFGFWFRSSIAGTYSFSLRNGAYTRSYVTTFTITSANTWQYVTISVTLDTSGTWTFDNTLGLQIDINCTTGATFQTSVLGSWQTGNFVMASTATNLFGTNGATMTIAQFSLIEGEAALDSSAFVRSGRTIGEELVMCQRYYEKTYDADVVPGSTNVLGMRSGVCVDGQRVFGGVPFRVTKRAAPTTQLYSQNGTAGKISATGAGDAGGSISIESCGTNGGIDPIGSGMTAGAGYYYHFTADAEL